MALEINLSGKSVLVTGAGRGLGVDIVKSLHAQNAIVYALGRNQDTLKELKQECPNIHIVLADLENWDETRRAVEAIGPIDCLVNNAALLLFRPLLDLTHDDFMKMVNVNLTSVLNICQVVAKGMVKAGKGGSIVNVSALATETGHFGITGYAASKAALDRLTWGLAMELGQYQIRVNTVNPTIMETDMSAGVRSNPEKFNEHLRRTPLGRIPTRDEVVNTILFVLSDLSPMTTGEKIFVDGGYRRA